MIHYILELELCLVIDHCYPLKISTKDGVSMCKASFSMEIHGQCWTYNYKSQGCIIAIYIYICQGTIPKSTAPTAKLPRELACWK
jgi:hypothetical protein